MQSLEGLMSNLKQIVLVGAAMLLICAVAVAAPQTKKVNNPYGAHLFIHDMMSPEMIEKHTTWARSMVGRDGYCKLFFYPVTEKGAPDTEGRMNGWKLAVQACYDKEMIPILRIGGTMKNGIWQKPADNKKTAEAIKDVVSRLPRNENYPIIVEVFNEPNLHIEWSGKTEPVEYAQFFVEVSKALRSLNDPKVIIANGALSPGGDFNNVKFITEVCTKVPEFINAFDIWATHCYPCCPPEKNMHDGTMPSGSYTLDLYVDELKELEKFGRKDLKVIITEGAYSLGTQGEDVRADYTMRAFRDYWSQWPEVLAVTPYEFSDPFGGNRDVNWVNPGSDTTPQGLPTVAHGQYWEVYNLAKPTDTTGAISGKVTESDFNAPLADAEVVLTPGNIKTKTNQAGNYFFPKLQSGSYTVNVTREFYKTPVPKKLQVKTGSNTVGDFVLQTTSKVTVTGTLTDTISGQPVPGVKVTSTPGDFEALTNEKGQFIFRGIPPSAYKLRSTKIGYYPFVTAEFVVKPDESVEVNWSTAPGVLPKTKHVVGPDYLEGAEGRSTVDGWSTSDGHSHPEIFQVDRSVCFTGQASQKITPNGSTNNSIWSISGYGVPETGKRYRVRVWCRTNDAEGEIKVVGHFLSNAMESSGKFEVKADLQGTNGWTLLTGTGIAPEFGNLKEKHGRLQVLLVGDLKKGSVWFDDVWAGEDADILAPPPPIDFKAEGGKFNANLSWNMPEGVKGITIVYKTGDYPTSIDDGRLVKIPTGATSVTQPDIHPSARWYFAAYSVAENGTLSEPVYASAQPVL